MKISIRVFIIILLLVLVRFNTIAQSTINNKHKVVIQLNTADTSAWSSTLGNIKNLQQVWPGSIQVEVVVHGKALDFLVKDKTHLAPDIANLTKQGVVFSACENSMRKHHIEKAALLTEVFTVPSGVAELILKQEQGWSYLKAGTN